jgi:hypothetical protein
VTCKVLFKILEIINYLVMVSQVLKNKAYYLGAQDSKFVETI